MFTKEQIRAVRGTKLPSDWYWVHAELFIDNKWTIPYLANEEKLSWHETSQEIYHPDESKMKDYLNNQFTIINKLLSEGYKLVSYEKFKEVIHRYHNPIDYKPTVVYL